MAEISDEELEQFNRYKELGEPDALQAQLQQVDTLTRERVISEAAAVAGYDPDVLETLSEGLELKVTEGVAFVGDVKLEDYASQNWSKFLPSLKATTETSTGGKKFVRQPVRGVVPNQQAGMKKLATNYIANTYGQPQAATVN